MAIITTKNGKPCAYIVGTGIAAITAYQNGDANHEEADEMTKIINISTNGIEDLNDSTDASQAIYDLQGRRLSEPQKGINIIDGKKILVK